MTKWDVELDEVVAVVVVAADGGRDKALDEWGGQPPGRAVSAFARRVGIESRTSRGNLARKNNAQNAARG